MKKNFTLLFCFLQIIAHSQKIEIQKLRSPESKANTDLAFLKKELQGKQLVMLGEQTHMYGNIFEQKARVLEYVHQELSFTTIAMESSMYDLWKMNQNEFTPKAFNDVIWGVWSHSAEFQRVVKYIEKNNLKVIGFDSQVNNSTQFIDDFYDYLESTRMKLSLDEDDVAIMIEGILENATIEEDDIKFKAYEKELKEIISRIQKLQQNDTNYYWGQFVKSLLACSQDAYYNKQEFLTTDFANKNHNIRDKQMADNLLSYMHRNPNEKIIAWADNIHIMNNTESIEKPIMRDFVSMGTHVANHLKEKSYSLATIHANDSLYDSGAKKWYATPIAKNSFEEALSKFNTPYLFVTSEQKGMRTAQPTRILNFIDFTEARLDQLHNGYLFIQKATLPRLDVTRDTIKSVGKEIVDSKEIKTPEIGQQLTYKGQILDAAMNTPIPFATIIVRNEEIYRVADENGFFELPVSNSKLLTATIAISSLGYDTKLVPLKNLTDKTLLQPKFEELDEVVITGFLSPMAVLKKAISKKEVNHPNQPFNFYRYGKVILNTDDVNELDLEIITKDEDEGYNTPYVITQRVEQIKWNINKYPKKFKYSSQFFTYRQNAIRYANILHKRKSKKFKLRFVTSKDPLDEDSFIIAFETERNKWNYTNRTYPTAYSGRVYINKASFAITKVIENWETTLKKDEIENYFTGDTNFEEIVETTIKEENICTYSQVNENGKYYATRYFNRRYSERLDNQNNKRHRIFERDSRLFDFELDDVENIDYELRNPKQILLNRVQYDQNFWDSFYEKQLK